MTTPNTSSTSERVPARPWAMTFALAMMTANVWAVVLGHGGLLNAVDALAFLVLAGWVAR